MIKDISKTIVFRFTNKFTKAAILTIKIPYLPFYAADGYYSRLYKRTKEGAAFGFEKSLVKGKVLFETAKTKRTILEFSNDTGSREGIEVCRRQRPRASKLIKGYLRIF